MGFYPGNDAPSYIEQLDFETSSSANPNLSNIGLRSYNFDAFNRIRTSDPRSFIAIKQLDDTSYPYLLDEQEVSGSGTSSSYLANRSARIIGVGNLTAGKRVLQSKHRLYYETGKSGFFAVTFRFQAFTSGCRCGVGLFDDENGIFFERDATGTLNFVIRSFVTGSAVDTVIPQSSWSVDRLDGSGGDNNPSGYDIANATNCLIFFADYQWLGVGSVRFGFEIDGIPYVAHQQDHANQIASVYMTNPHLPIRWEVENDGTGGANRVECICAVGAVEGGTDSIGISRTIMRLQQFDQPAQNVWYPILSLRLKSGTNGIIRYKSASIVTVQNGYWAWGLFLNPTIAGTDNASWVGVTDSALEYDQSRTSANSLADDKERILVGGFVAAQNRSVSEADGIDLPLGKFIDGTSDEFVLAIRNLNANNDDFWGSITVQELI